MDEGPTPKIHPSPSPAKSLVSLGVESLHLYGQHGVSFTLPLLRPLGFQFIGAFLAIVAPYRIMNAMTKTGVIQDPLLLVVLTLLVLIPATYLFTQGFWEYLIYMVSMNLNVEEVLSKKALDFKGAYRRVESHSGAFTSLLLILMGLWLLPFLCVALPGLLMVLFPQFPLATLCLGGGGLLALFLGLVATVLSVYLCLSFQVFAYEAPPLTPWGVIKRSFHLIEGNFWRAVGVLLLVTVLTNFLAPGMVTLAFDLSQVTDWLGKGLQGLLQELIESMFPTNSATGNSVAAMFYQYALSHLNSLSLEIVRTLLYSLVTGLLLPLGTFYCALFYFDTRVRHSVEFDADVVETKAA